MSRPCAWAVVFLFIGSAQLLIPAVKATAQTRRDATLAEQKTCYEQAKRYEGRHSFVVNHYDKARNVCFVRVAEELYDKQDEHKYLGGVYQLLDAFEGFMYGLCVSDANNKVKACWANQPTSNDQKNFDTTDAWMQYVTQTYMSQ